MRLRALPLLLVLTAADYALWKWSIAGGQDVVSLISGLTLLPLAATTLALLVIAVAWLSGRLLERARDRRRAGARTGRPVARARSHRGPTQDPAMPSHAAAAERTPERDSRRLAA